MLGLKVISEVERALESVCIHDVFGTDTLSRVQSTLVSWDNPVKQRLYSYTHTILFQAY